MSVNKNVTVPDGRSPIGHLRSTVPVFQNPPVPAANSPSPPPIEPSRDLDDMIPNLTPPAKPCGIAPSGSPNVEDGRHRRPLRVIVTLDGDAPLTPKYRTGQKWRSNRSRRGRRVILTHLASLQRSSSPAGLPWAA